MSQERKHGTVYIMQVIGAIHAFLDGKDNPVYPEAKKILREVYRKDMEGVFKDLVISPDQVDAVKSFYKELWKD